MLKGDWTKHISNVLETNKIFSVSVRDANKAPLLFACDIFRRRRHPVNIHFDPTAEHKLNLHVTIEPIQNTIEFTVKRDDTPEQLIAEMSDSRVEYVSIRGCGTVINTVCQVIEWAIHTGWLVEKSFLNTLIQLSSNNSKQRNTTLLVTLRRASRDSI